eukprot:1821591-Rhodomonas_salina.1
MPMTMPRRLSANSMRWSRRQVRRSGQGPVSAETCRSRRVSGEEGGCRRNRSSSGSCGCAKQAALPSDRTPAPSSSEVSVLFLFVCAVFVCVRDSECARARLRYLVGPCAERVYAKTRRARGELATAQNKTQETAFSFAVYSMSTRSPLLTYTAVLLVHP